MKQLFSWKKKTRMDRQHIVVKIMGQLTEVREFYIIYESFR